ncbi:PucR family transcriptional regulator [Planotetraspora kaengkrachanensis]|uniref:Putative transcriptional regulator n=1 Tax=Planotetraspora kaengkrachanensis TaxID=575193 RepID=A0A8J3V8S7_9ACTN|nr:helix-turn-helix domain-containing protein [Planotetraspora kaengkrachanensis]GIG82256.1 putative transcriptional regulator [Planotetraspora kaengkrachanensis]
MRRLNALAERVATRLDQLAVRMVDAFVAEIPLYAHLPREQLEGEVLEICRHNLRLFFRLFSHDELPDEREILIVRRSAALRAEERVPLETVLAAYRVGTRIGWQQLCDDARPDERADLFEAAHLVITFNNVVTGAVAAAYLEERQAIHDEDREERRRLAEALLAGTPARRLAERADHRLADGYHVLAVRVESSVDERDEEVERAVAARRKLRRMEQSLADDAGHEPQPLSVLTPGGGMVLLPCTDPDDRDARAADVVARMAKAADAPVFAGLATGADPGGVPSAAAEADRVLGLAVRLNAEPGTYTLDDVLLEYVLSSAGDVGRRLADVLQPLESGPELVQTLAAWFANDFHRVPTAASLHIHPNTLDYRLTRICELTGYSVGSGRGVLVLGAALALQTLGRNHNERS